ncbi:TRAP transporter substrate-binding protein [Egibacter rhizosphaerae]|uniref:TRAP transporter substrate-binding protein n=1 Tax=Egibacter rhizosphaerae TaxID=1670831 RepID=A0A411YE52_9ACTN|nr:TRAP transporter substrate-binding protein [Egibacter rhizosphaerae]QBI19397.1 TRAP transporter substrate-binding protein [Egibacter rhizosphaerae]
MTRIMSRFARGLIAASVLALLLVACEDAEETTDDEPEDEAEAEPDEAADDDDEADEADDEDEADHEDAEADDEADHEADEADEADDVDFGDEVTLTFGHPFPPTDPIQVNVWEPWVEDVREATDGTVDVEIHAGGALAGGDAIYENVVAGAQDIGWTMPGYTPGRFPITQIIEAPFVFEDAVQGTEVAHELWDEFDAFRDEYDDTEVLALWAMDTGDLFTRDEPVETLEDVEGLTVRSPAPLQTDALEEMGASATGMPGPEIYDSIERGVIDGYKLANSATRVFDLGDTTDYRTECNCYTGAFVLVMSPAAWEQLSPAQQDAIADLTGNDLALELAEAHAAAAAEVEEEYWPEHDVEAVELSDDEFDRWFEAVDPVFQSWIEEREEEGVPGTEMADRVFELTGRGE